MSDPTRTTPADPLAGYTSAPPPGAGGPAVYQVGARWQLSGWWRRVGAALIDGLVITVAAGVLLALVLAIFGSVFVADDVAGVLAVMFGILVWGLFAVVAALLYAPWMMASTNGRTLGRMAVGIRVVRANGQPLTFGFAALREVVVKWLLFNVVGGSLTLGIAPLLDVLWPLWDEEHRALHDFLVDTRTILD